MLISEVMQNLAVEVEAELGLAREKFPNGWNLNMALLEEAGEFASLRIIEEGDASLVVNAETVKP